MLLLLGLGMAGTGSAQDDPASTRNILNEDGRFSIFLAASDAAGLSGALDAFGPYTLFVPTDAAISAYLDAQGISPDAFLADTAHLQRVLLYHLLPGVYSAENVSDIAGQNAATFLAGASLSISSAGDSLLVNGLVLSETNIVANTNMIHVIDGVLIPEDGLGSTDTLFEIALTGGDTALERIQSESEDPRFQLSIMAQLLDIITLEDTVNNPQGYFTIFAPNDGAFERYLERSNTTFASATSNESEIARLMSYHVIPAAYAPADLAQLGTAVLGTALEGRSVVISQDGERTTVNGIAITAPPQFTRNAVIYPLDALLFPLAQSTLGSPDDASETVSIEEIESTVTLGSTGQSSISTLLNENSTLSTLAAAIAATDLSTLLNDEGPFTLLAPTDAAFEAYLSNQGISIEDLLSDFDQLAPLLLYHLLPGRLDSEVITTREDNSLGTALPSAFVPVAAISISQGDIEANNGLIHVIDSVLVPEGGDLRNLVMSTGEDNLIAVLAGEDEYSLFAQALAAAGLDVVLANAGPYTLFAPNNEALSAFLVQAGLGREEFLADTALLRTIVFYHIIPYRVAVEAMPIGRAADYGTLLAGNTLALSRDAEDLELVFVNIFPIADDPFEAANGLIYPLNDVLGTE